MIICPRCNREAKGWPLQRRDLCSPKDWASCIRNPETILSQPQVRIYNLKAGNGRRIRKATAVILPGGYTVHFTERMSQREAIRQAEQLRAAGYAE